MWPHEIVSNEENFTKKWYKIIDEFFVIAWVFPMWQKGSYYFRQEIDVNKL